MLGVHKTISLPQSTEYAKEMAKWEAYPSQWGPAGRPYRFAEYPMRVYTFRYESGKGIVQDEAMTVGSPEEREKAERRGFLPLQEAYDACERQQTEFGKLAAEREYNLRHGKHSEKAVAEIRAAEEEHGAQHMPDVPKPSRSEAMKRVWADRKAAEAAAVG